MKETINLIIIVFILMFLLAGIISSVLCLVSLIFSNMKHNKRNCIYGLISTLCFAIYFIIIDNQIFFACFAILAVISYYAYKQVSLQEKVN